MFNLDSRTARIVAVFAATATTVMFAGCTKSVNGWNVEYDDQELTDDNGDSYTLHANGDGTETARYEDGREVTFMHHNDGTLDYVSGTGSLLAGLAASYFLFNGFNAPGGRFDGKRYVVNQPLYKLEKQERDSAMTSRYGSTGSRSKSDNPTQKTPKSVAGSKAPGSPKAATEKTSPAANTAKNNTGSTQTASSSSSTKSKSTSGSSVKSGFGGAGARSASS